ncbi:MAG: hypothetical protein ACRDRJ_32415 [Streptosporangiaceae bacterium]
MSCAVTGPEHVITSQVGLSEYLDPYSLFGPGRDPFCAAAAVRPATTGQVQDIVRIAWRHRRPLWPVSTGRNLACGGPLGPNIRRPLGRGRGSMSEPPAGAAELVAWLAGNARAGRRPGDLALLGFAAGLDVPEDTVRAAFAAAAARIRLPIEASMPPGNFDVLNSPLVAPSFLTGFLDR